MYLHLHRFSVVALSGESKARYYENKGNEAAFS